jgi:hypothetical protein
VLGRRTLDLARRAHALSDADAGAMAALLAHALPPPATSEHEHVPPASEKTDTRE